MRLLVGVLRRTHILDRANMRPKPRKYLCSSEDNLIKSLTEKFSKQIQKRNIYCFCRTGLATDDLPKPCVICVRAYYACANRLSKCSCRTTVGISPQIPGYYSLGWLQWLKDYCDSNVGNIPTNHAVDVGISMTTFRGGSKAFMLRGHLKQERQDTLSKISHR
ncbi:hypothetical protein PoB_007446900 [Plakobranchus ocellatus]|uniref:Uncharacterized protein n=1 Tax=Plakobranchus ocellatus TaxID=259542 RepID=A0AAV4DUP0_9GAST|nr:hypothetical protein PoB_007446900 [Plakobranchus ocellatus]